MKITAIILTKNEEKNIERAIKSVGFCDEIILVDDFSSDKTIEKIKSIKSDTQILSHDSKGDFASQRNWAMEKAKNEWILFVDADETISCELKSEIESSAVSHQSSVCAYYIKRRDFWWGRELRYGEVAKARNKGIIRLVKKGSGEWKGAVHEEFATSLSVGQLEGCINHYPHPTLKEFIHDINIYSTLRAHELQKQGKKGSILPILLYPTAKFILTYFIYLGFLDGAAGFAYAFLMSFHSFLVRAKLFQYTRIDVS
ncbi:glycosyltransferase family 2 protein [Candidatus Roizmanbacteria bacterium]|nr:glycosyltransferase family 2 protein [Candidatus Roizmanbacteria bacterium]